MGLVGSDVQGVAYEVIVGRFGAQTPFGIADFAILHGDIGIAIVIAFNLPLKAEIAECRRLDDEFVCGDGVVRLCDCWDCK